MNTVLLHQDDEEVTVKEICRVLKISRTKFFALVKEEALVTHLTITGRRAMWKQDLLAAREQARQRVKKAR